MGESVFLELISYHPSVYNVGEDNTGILILAIAKKKKKITVIKRLLGKLVQQIKRLLELGYDVAFYTFCFKYIDFFSIAMHHSALCFLYMDILNFFIYIFEYLEYKYSTSILFY